MDSDGFLYLDKASISHNLGRILHETGIVPEQVYSMYQSSTQPSPRPNEAKWGIIRKTGEKTPARREHPRPLIYSIRTRSSPIQQTQNPPRKVRRIAVNVLRLWLQDHILRQANQSSNHPRAYDQNLIDSSRQRHQRSRPRQRDGIDERGHETERVVQAGMSLTS